MSVELYKTLQVCIPALVFLLSALALSFSRRNWYEENRPIVTADIETHSAGSEGITFTLVVTNSGRRPALNVQIRPRNMKDLERAIDAAASKAIVGEIHRVFSEKGEIPILKAGGVVSNGFGNSSIYPGDGALNYWSRIPIVVTYTDLTGQKFKTKQVLIVRDSEYFAGSGWKKVS